jgi:hypothetical protein
MQSAYAVLYFHLVSLSLQCFSTLSHKGIIFGKELLDTKRVFCVSLKLLFEIFLVLRRIQRDNIIKFYVWVTVHLI